MTPVPAKRSADGAAKNFKHQRFKQWILHSFFVRFNMSLILAVVVASGLLSSKLMLELGILSLQVRYPLALLISFGAFLLLIRIWIWLVFLRRTGGVDLANLDPGGLEIPDFGGGADSASVHFGGGDSGGAGASSSWDGGGGSSSSGGSGVSGFDLDLGDGFWVAVVAALVALAIAGAGGYLIYVAPEILPEAAWQLALATGLARVPKPVKREHWLRNVVRASAIPFGVALVLVMILAFVAHNHCPGAVKLAEAFHCAALSE